MSELKVNSIKGVSASTAAISIDNSSGSATANLTTVNSVVMSNGGSLSNRNLIINGAMQISQRSTSAVNIGGGKTYSDVDRFGQWTKTAEGNFKSGQQVEDAPTDFKYSRKITSLAANTIASNSYHTVRYAVEGFDAKQLNCGFSSAKTVTLSFYVKSSLTGTFGLNFTNSANNRSYPTTYTISSADTWERKTITLTLDTTGTWPTGNDVGLELNWVLAMGSSYISSTLNQWQAGWKFPNTGANTILTTNGATWQLTGVQLEVGSVATDFEHRSFGQEIALCERYYYRTDTGGTATNLVGLTVEGATTAAGGQPHPTRMRATPTITLGSGTLFFSPATGVITPSVHTNRCSKTHFALVVTISGATAGQSSSLYRNDANGYIEVSAEL